MVHIQYILLECFLPHFRPAYIAEGLLELVEDDEANGQALRITKAMGRDVVKFEEHPLQ